MSISKQTIQILRNTSNSWSFLFSRCCYSMDNISLSMKIAFRHKFVSISNVYTLSQCYFVLPVMKVTNFDIFLSENYTESTYQRLCHTSIIEMKRKKEWKHGIPIFFAVPLPAKPVTIIVGLHWTSCCFSISWYESM